VKLKRLKRTPLILALSVLALVGGVRLWNPDFIDQLECKTYDLRVRLAQEFPGPVTTNLAFVAMQDSSIAAVKNGKANGVRLGYQYGLYWPRQVYGRVVEELSAQGAKAIGFDVLFGELRPDHPPVEMANGSLMESDDFFALQMRRAGNVITALTPEVNPPALFATNCLMLGDISSEKDSDGVLRRMKAFTLNWHPVFKSAAQQWGINLARAKIEPGKILLPLPNGTNLTVALDPNGNFDLTDFLGDELPPGWKRFDKPCERVWDLGIVLAAQQLKLDLEHAEINVPAGKIILRGPHGIERTIPVDKDGNFYINWQITANDPRLTRAPIENVLVADKLQLAGETNGLPNQFHDKLVVVGSAATGNDLSDHGATPLEKDTLLVSKHWNVANSVITGEFIRRTTVGQTLGIILLLGLASAFLTWQLRALAASVATLLLIAVYIAGAVFGFVHFHLWLPLVYPVFGAILLEHVNLVTYRVVFEEREQRRVKTIFSKIVAPEIVNELLQVEKLALGGARREMTVFFADVRGFTTLTDQMQESVTEFIRSHNIERASKEKLLEESARETLETVNDYLAVVAEAIKKHGGTLDKYIGDCVMAFWNAPVADDRHALNCVRAAIDAQRAIAELNQQRLAKNTEREFENSGRAAAGLPPKPMLAALQLGTGINTGHVTTGLMGSEKHGFNYTVFGREVNLASRLEGISGSGRIIISEATWNHLQRLAPDLAATCVELPPVTVKGIKNAVRIYEVPWK
jgi:class 3 adenylate cyclase/CHASE2 domain-containing sensor protein